MNLNLRAVTKGLAAALATGSLVGTSVLAGGAHAATARHAADSATHRPTSLADVLAADGHRFDHNWADFDILDKAVMTVLRKKPNSAVGVLAKPRVKLTAFLPTDRAFRHLAEDLTGKAPRTEKGTFTTLAKAVGVDGIESVLLYHVVPGKTLGARKVLASDGRKLTTAQGGTITVRVHHKTVRLVDAARHLRNPKVIATNVNQGNPQIAHVINRVLLPINP